MVSQTSYVVAAVAPGRKAIGTRTTIELTLYLEVKSNPGFRNPTLGPIPASPARTRKNCSTSKKNGSSRRPAKTSSEDPPRVTAVIGGASAAGTGPRAG